MLRLLRGLLGFRKAAAGQPVPSPEAPAAHEQASLDRARVHLDAGELAQGRALLEPYAATSHRLETLFLLCRLRVAQGEVDGALKLLKRAFTLHPGAPELLETAALAHEMKNQPVQSLEYLQRLVFMLPTPPAKLCVKWMRAYIQAGTLRQPRSGDVVARVAALLDRAPDLAPAHRLAFAEWLYAYLPARQEAVDRYRAASAPEPNEQDVSAVWLDLDAWCERSALPLHRGQPLGEGTPPVYLAELKDVRVMPGFQWIPVLDDGAVALRGFEMVRMRSRSETPRSPHLLSNRDQLELRLLRAPRYVDTPALLIGGMPQYYHQTIDFLSVLSVAEALDVGTALPLVVNRDLAPFQREQLGLLGYGDDRLLLVGEEEQVIFRHLLVPTRLTRGGQWMHPLIPDWYRRRLAAPLARRAPGAKVYLSRQGASRRRITNETAVIALLVERGYVVAHPEALGAAQQIELFAGASHLIAPSGAALTNMVYMPPGATVFALASLYALAVQRETYFDALATACGHRFAWLPGRPVGVAGANLNDADFELELDALRQLLDAGTSPPLA